MPALVAGIHVFEPANKDVDGRNKSGHDELLGQPRLFGCAVDVRRRGCAIPPRSRGRGEMVDARDLKSLGSNFPCRFKSGRPHHIVNGVAEYRVRKIEVRPRCLATYLATFCIFRLWTAHS
jgi:hypothetical protein